MTLFDTQSCLGVARVSLDKYVNRVLYSCDQNYLDNVTYVLAALIAILKSQKSVPLWGNVNLDNCSPQVNHCRSKVTPYLIGCTTGLQARCVHRCPVGQPVISPSGSEGLRCGVVCLSGHFVNWETAERCRPHSLPCPIGQSVIQTDTLVCLSLLTLA